MKKIGFGLFLYAAIACSSGSKSDSNEPAEPAPLQDFQLSQNQTFAVKLVWNNPPVSLSSDNSADIYFFDPNGQPASTSQLTRFHLYMASMGHPSINEEEQIVTQLDPGHWRVSRIFFSMGGPRGSWVVDLAAEVNGHTDHVRVSIDYDIP